MASDLHLAVALDGTGWHPAAWREPTARPDALFSPGYWADLARTAERGLLDFVAFEDTFGIQAALPGRRPDDADRVDLVGPLPDVDPDEDAPPIIQGRAFVHQDRHATVARWREIAKAKQLSLRGLVLDQFTRGPFVGTAAQVADALDDFVQNDGVDGVIIGSHLVPWGLDEFVDQVVPLLQERGSLRAEYTGSTLRDNLGLPVPDRARVAAAS